MNKTFLDERFKARMDYLRKRFPVEDFRRCFKEQYKRNGIVMIQPIVNKDMEGVMIADSEAGFIFNNEHNLNTALQLLHLWGFNITTRLEHDECWARTTYIVQLPHEYLKRHLGNDWAGIIYTGLHSLQMWTELR